MLKGCLLHGIIIIICFCKLNIQCVKLICCIKVSFVIIVPVTAVNAHIRTGKNRSMLPTASNCMGAPSNFLAALEYEINTSGFISVAISGGSYCKLTGLY